MIAQIAGTIGVAIGIAVMLGWLFRIKALVSIIPGAATMKTNTALCFIFAGLALMFLRDPVSARMRGFARLCAGLVLLTGALTLCEYWFGWNLGIDQIVIRDHFGFSNKNPGRMAPASALGFLFLGLAQLLIDAGKLKGRSPAQGFALFTTLIGMIGLTGYVYGAPALYRLASYASVAVHTALLFLVLGVGTILVRPGSGWMGVITSSHGGGLMARRILPVAVTCPFFIGWLRLEGQRAGWYGTEFGIGLFVTLNVVTFATLIWFSARILNAIDVKRHAAEDSLRDAHDGLEQRVAARTTELALAQKLLQEVLDAATGISVIAGDASGLITLFNGGAERMLGYKAEELIGKQTPALIHLESEMIARGQELTKEFGRPIEGFDVFVEHTRHDRHESREWTYRRKDGSKFPVMLDVTAIRDEAGEITGFLGIATDLTERKRAEEQLERIAGIVASSHDAIISKTLEGIILSWNPGAEKMYGYTAEEAIGKSVMMLLPPDRVAEEAEIIQRIKAHEFIDQYESVRMRKDGSLVDVSLTISAVKDSAGQVIGASKIARDITERRRADAALHAASVAAVEANRAKSDFLANMSHEIRTPMNGVIGMTHLLLDSDLSEVQRQQAGAISRSGESLLSIINDILDFSKIEAGKLTFEDIDFDLHEAVHGSLEMLAQRAQSKGLELACLLEPDVPVYLRGDPGRVRQVLINFVGNAIKFTERGEVVVKVSLENESDKDAFLRFEVKDSGIGIPADARLRLFQPFSQADSSTTRKYGGTGLGLVISKQLIEHMHGTVGVESALGQGSVFWFTARLTKQLESAHPRLATGDDLMNSRVLIVDDNETNRQILQHQTRAWKMSSGVAVNAEEALAELRGALVAGNPYQVVLLDMQMPGTNGLTLARIIKAESALAGVKIILLSSFGDRIGAEELRAAGINDCLVKPLNQSLLFNSIATVMASRAVDSIGKVEKVLPPASAPVHVVQKLRILLAEDNPVNQQVAIGLLRKLGYQADVASNGVEALEAMKRVDYDIVFMDCQMPLLDGYETTHRIRQLEQERTSPFDRRKPLHIIAMTANAMEGDREKCLAAGMNDYLSKPVRKHELQGALNRRSEIQGTTVANSSENSVALSRDPASPEEVLVDLDRLRDITDDEPDRMRQLIDLYMTQTVPMLDGLNEAILTNSSAEVASIAHKLVGSSVSCGVEAFTASLRGLERLGQNGDLSGAHALFDDVRHKFPLVRSVFTQFMQTRQHSEA